MSEVHTTWTEATNNANRALVALVSCVESGKNAWIEVRKNGEQAFPIKKKNPELDNPFNWTMSFGLPRNESEMMKHNYFNDTQKDLTYNWTACFGEIKAIEEYQSNGTIVKGLINGSGACHPVKIKDANFYRKNIAGDNYEYDFWVTYWKPKDGIPYWVVDDSVGDVFTICYNDEEVDKTDAIRNAARFMMEYADAMSRRCE